MQGRRLRHIASLVAVVVCAAGCRYEPEGAAPLEVPSVYRQWWAEVEECAQRKATMDRVRFWVLKGDKFPCPNGPCIGRWNSPHDVYIAETWVNDAALVKHEMLHDLLGTGDHPPAIFGEKACNVAWMTRES
ncbi:MAG: hypothetical protein IT359_05925 [Gemmatimonadaceae bacterium]|nr:hypothetical protein [Gemmatimonadaceae bacterium]